MSPALPSFSSFRPESISHSPKNIVYSAAGAHSSALTWMVCDSVSRTSMDFAVFISYYDQPSCQSENLMNLVHSTSGIFEYRSGYKMDLLFSAMQNSSYRTFFQHAEYISILDDDLSLNVRKINLLFSIHKGANLMLSTPSISPPGRGWKSNVHVDGCLFRRGAFVEVHSLTLSMSLLRIFFSTWTPHFLVGWGTEHAMASIFRIGLNMSESDYGVIDAVQVANVEKRSDTGSREIDTLASSDTRAEKWNQYQEQFPNQVDSQWIEDMKPKWKSFGYGQCVKITPKAQVEIERSLQCS